MGPKLQRFFSASRMPGNFVRFYAVGLLLFAVPYTRSLFVLLTAPSLLLVIAAVFLYHRKWNARTIAWFLFIAVSSFLVEMQGVNSGDIFGHYRYGLALGPKIHGTPLLIGLNWLLLVYASHDVAASRVRNPAGRILAGAGLMLLYDAVLEAVAPVMRMWRFEGAYPPAANFIAWFVLSVIYLSGMEALKISSDNRPARALFWTQLGFFLLIATYSLAFPDRPRL